MPPHDSTWSFLQKKTASYFAVFVLSLFSRGQLYRISPSFKVGEILKPFLHILHTQVRLNSMDLIVRIIRRICR